MKITKKKITISILITTLAALILVTNSHANMFNRFKKGFYFEKYKTAEEAKAALIELHPIGSNVEGLVRTLEISGCTINKVEQDKLNAAKKTNSKYQGIDEIINCILATGFMDWIEWRISITIKNNKIDDIGIGKEYMGL